MNILILFLWKNAETKIIKLNLSLKLNKVHCLKITCLSTDIITKFSWRCFKCTGVEWTLTSNKTTPIYFNFSQNSEVPKNYLVHWKTNTEEIHIQLPHRTTSLYVWFSCLTTTCRMAQFVISSQLAEDSRLDSHFVLLWHPPVPWVSKHNRLILMQLNRTQHDYRHWP